MEGCWIVISYANRYSQCLKRLDLLSKNRTRSDKRKIMIFPSSLYQLSPEKRNSEMESGVKNTEEESEDIISEEIDF
jgi:hypothetical protein